jgi:hypothetical protein
MNEKLIRRKFLRATSNWAAEKKRNFLSALNFPFGDSNPKFSVLTTQLLTDCNGEHEQMLLFSLP